MFEGEKLGGFLFLEIVNMEAVGFADEDVVARCADLSGVFLYVGYFWFF